MTRLVTISVVFVTAVSAAAGPVRLPTAYPVPGKGPCRVQFEADSPVVRVLPSGGRKVTATAEYGYDNDWKFDGLSVYLTYSRPGRPPNVPVRFDVPDESTLGTPGNWPVTFEIAAPDSGTGVTITAELAVTKGGQRRVVSRALPVNPLRAALR